MNDRMRLLHVPRRMLFRPGAWYTVSALAEQANSGLWQDHSVSVMPAGELREVACSAGNEWPCLLPTGTIDGWRSRRRDERDCADEAADSGIHPDRTAVGGRHHRHPGRPAAVRH